MVLRSSESYQTGAEQLLEETKMWRQGLLSHKRGNIWQTTFPPASESQATRQCRDILLGWARHQTLAKPRQAAVRLLVEADSPAVQH